MKFNILDLQKNIEEKRLIFGIKLINFCKENLLAFFFCLTKIFDNFLSRKDSVFLSCFFIISLAAITISNRDLGHDSTIYIEIANKILDGKKYYYDFFENNFPLAFFITTIPVFIAKILNINAIIVTQIFIFLIGILSIFSCTQILQEKPSITNLFNKNYETKLLLISLCFAYFFRAYTTHFGEYATKSSYFLACAFPYICLHLSAKFSTKRQIISAILAALIICLKPHYAILITIFEIAKFYNFFDEKRSFFSKISGKRNYSPTLNFSIIIIILTIYAILIQKFTPQYFQFLQNFSALYFEINYINFMPILRENIYPLAFLLIIFAKQKEGRVFRTFFLAIISAILITSSELIGGRDQRFIIFAIALPFIITQFYNLVKENRIQINKNLLLALSIFILPQFDSRSFFDLALNLCYFWWILLFFNKKPTFLLIFLAILSISLLFLDKKGDFAWIFCAFITLFLFKKTKKFDENGFLNSKIIIILFLIFSYFLSLFLSEIFYSSNLRSPNEMNSQKIALIKKYAPQKKDKVIFIADQIFDTYPILIYAQKQNPLPALQHLVFYEKINEQEFFDIKKQSFDHLFSSIKRQLTDENLKIIFIKKNIFLEDKCQINFLEYYFRDEEFRQKFLNNYKFLTQIHRKHKTILVKNIFENEDLNQIKPSEEMIYGEVEVYIRKK